jgi:TolB-like protein
MIFKITAIAVIFILAGAVLSYPVEKWNVAVARWQDLSAKKDTSIGLTMRKSVSLRLQKEKNFSILAGMEETNIIENYSNAVETGRKNKADAIIYGSYYIEGENLIAVTEVFDVLEKQIKMRKTYTGKITADIFETVDEMAQDMSSKIKEILPAFTEESETRIKKIRETVYQTEEIKVKRMFYTRFGVISDLGNKDLHYNLNSSSPGSYNKPIPYYGFALGLAFRYWDFRFDFIGSGLPGLPAYDGRLDSFSIKNSSISFFLYILSYYLPWFDNSLAIGIGGVQYDKITSLSTYNGEESYNKNSLSGIPLTVSVIWNPYSFWEIGFYIRIINNSVNTYTADAAYKEVFSEDIPAFGISTIFFLGNFGIEARFHTELNCKYERYRNDVLTDQSKNSIISTYIGMVYRIDFLNQGN